MDRTLSKAGKEVNDLGQGFVKGFAKDMFGKRGGKARKEEEAAKKAAKEEAEAAAFAAKEAERAQKAAGRATGADHMARANSKFAGGAKPQRWARPKYGEGMEEAEANMQEVRAHAHFPRACHQSGLDG